MKIEKLKFIVIAIIAFTLVFNIIGYIYLPDKMVLQVKFDGSKGTELPKLIYLIGSFVVISVLSVLLLKNEIAKAKLGLGLVLASIINILSIILNIVL